MFLDFIEHVVYINLEHRTDRRAEVEKELECFGDRVERFNAIINHTHGGIGCYKSHLEVLENAKARGWKNVLVVEDDFMWNKLETETGTGISRLTEIASEPFDVILLASTYAKFEPKTLRVISAQAATCYLVPLHYYDTLIENYKEGIPQLENTLNWKKYANDQWWKKLQPRDHWYIMSPSLGFQRPSFSDIEKRAVDYRRVFA